MSTGVAKFPYAFPVYTVKWSDQHGQFEATCDWVPQMAFLSTDCVRALEGLTTLLQETFSEEDWAEVRKANGH